MALGGASPRRRAISPFLHRGVWQAVIVLASFRRSVLGRYPRAHWPIAAQTGGGCRAARLDRGRSDTFGACGGSANPAATSDPRNMLWRGPSCAAAGLRCAASSEGVRPAASGEQRAPARLSGNGQCAVGSAARTLRRTMPAPTHPCTLPRCRQREMARRRGRAPPNAIAMSPDSRPPHRVPRAARSPSSAHMLTSARVPQAARCDRRGP